MIKELKPAFLMLVVITALTGVVYPALVTALAQMVFPQQANGSLIVLNGQVVGSTLIGQGFARPEYFHPRPSAAGRGYDPTATGGTNLGPTSAKLMNGTTKLDDKQREVVDFDGIKLRIVRYCVENGIPYESSPPLSAFAAAGGELDNVRLIKAFNGEHGGVVFTPKTPIPADAVTTSASGLDPHISPANALLQVARVAGARGVSTDIVGGMVARHTESRTFGFLGEARVNVLQLNLDLDRQYPRR